MSAVTPITTAKPTIPRMNPAVAIPRPGAPSGILPRAVAPNTMASTSQTGPSQIVMVSTIPTIPSTSDATANPLA